MQKQEALLCTLVVPPRAFKLASIHHRSEQVGTHPMAPFPIPSGDAC